MPPDNVGKRWQLPLSLYRYQHVNLVKASLAPVWISLLLDGFFYWNAASTTNMCEKAYISQS